MFTPTETILSAALSTVLTMLGSRWIDRLYAREDAPLTFPEAISARSRFRRPLLSIGLFVCLIAIVERPTVEALYLTAAAFLLLLITATDFEQYVIFDRMSLPLAALGLLMTMHLGLPIADRLTAAGVGGGVSLALTILTGGALGGGDIKLIAALGLWLGSERLLDVVFYGSIAGGVAALLMLLTKQKDRKSAFAYGPYFALTALFFLLNQPQ